MEKESYRFRDRYKDKYRVMYERGLNEDTGRKIKLSTFIPSYIRQPERIDGQEVYTYMVYPFIRDGKTLAAFMPRRKSINLVREFSDIFTLHLEADDGMLLLFNDKDLPAVARKLMLRTKRRLSARQKEQNVKRLTAYQFKGSKFARKNGKTA